MTRKMSQTQYTIIQQRPPSSVLQQSGSFTLREPSPITTLTPMSPPAPTQLYTLQQPQSPSLFLDNGNVQFTEIKTEPQPYSPSNVSTTSPLPAGKKNFWFKISPLDGVHIKQSSILFSMALF